MRRYGSDDSFGLLGIGMLLPVIVSTFSSMIFRFSSLGSFWIMSVWRSSSAIFSDGFCWLVQEVRRKRSESDMTIDFSVGI